MIQNALYYINYIRNICNYQLDILEKTIGRMLPAFANIEAEAKTFQETEFERLGSMPATGNEDMGDMAEEAFDAALAHYEAMTSARQIMLNTMTIALHHLFEQQVFAFCRHELIRTDEDSYKTFNWKQAIARINDDLGINCETFSSYAKATELRHAGNAIKHADGPSAYELRNLRPDLFVHPALREDKRVIPPTHLPIYLPLAGQDLFVTEDDLREYFNAVRQFWNEMTVPMYESLAAYLQHP